MSIFQINGVDAPPGADLTIDVADVDGNAERNAAAQMIRDRIAVKRTISVSYRALPQEDYMTLLTMMSGVNFTVTYPDPMEGDVITKTMYVGNRRGKLKRWDDREKIWTEISFDLVEV